MVTPKPEPIVSAEQLQHLLGLQGESETLDYKSQCDLNDKRACIELAKDVAAMQVLGGYIVIGADDNGNPVESGVSEESATLFDEARLRPKLLRWLPEPLQLMTAAHVIDKYRFVVIYVAPNTDGFCITKAEGAFDDGGTKKLIFRQGEVFSRHGTSSERWNQSDIRKIWDRVIATRKEEWRTELRSELLELQAGREAQQLTDGPLGNYTWRLDQDSFHDVTLELFRRDDDIPIRSLLDRVVLDARRLIEEDDWDELATLVGRTTTVAALALRHERPMWFDSAVGALLNVYQLGFEPESTNTRDSAGAINLWLVVIEHVLALGGLAVRRADWAAVRSLVTRPPEPVEPFYATWLRHGLTMASRANRFEVPGGGSKSLLVMATERAAGLPALAAGAADDAILTSLCQFDMLAALVIIDETGSLSTGNWYTNFARFHSTRSEPVVQRLLADHEMREIIFRGSDQLLATALRKINEMATSESFRFDGWWGFGPPVSEFIDKHSD